MSLLKLSKMVIHTSNITSVRVLPGRYVIDLVPSLSNNNNIKKNIVTGMGVFQTTDSSIYICKDNDPNDYEIVNKWFKKID